MADAGFCVCTGSGDTASCAIDDPSVDNTVQLSDGRGVQIPGGALSASVVVGLQVESLAEGSVLMTAKSDVLTFTPSGTTFLKPVTLIFNLQKIPPKGKRLAVHRYNPRTGRWEEKQGSSTSSKSNSVSVQTSSFSSYAVFEMDCQLNEQNQCKRKYVWRTLEDGYKDKKVPLQAGALGSIFAQAGFDTWLCMNNRHCPSLSDSFCWVHNEMNTVWAPWGDDGWMNRIEAGQNSEPCCCALSLNVYAYPMKAIQKHAAVALTLLGNTSVQEALSKVEGLNLNLAELGREVTKSVEELKRVEKTVDACGVCGGNG